MTAPALTILCPAPDHSRFDPKAFEASIGKELTVSIDGAGVFTATVIDAHVIDRGKAIVVTFAAENVAQ